MTTDPVKSRPTMTVADLRAALDRYPDDTLVIASGAGDDDETYALLSVKPCGAGALCVYLDVVPWPWPAEVAWPERTFIVGKTGHGQTWLPTIPMPGFTIEGSIRRPLLRRLWDRVPMWRPGPMRCGYPALFGCRRFGLLVLEREDAMPCPRHAAKEARRGSR